MNLRTHGDTLVRPGSLDFAVNVWPGPRPATLERALQAALLDRAYPDEREAREAVAGRHGRAVEEVLLCNGACEAFWLLAHALRPTRAACVHPGFTEPEAALRAAGADVTRIFREQAAWRLDPREVPDEAEIVVVGNPDNPTGALESASSLRSLRRPGRLVVVDESFMEFVSGAQPSLGGDSDFVVIRSLTKLWSLAGIRAGYLLGPAELVERLAAQRQPWSVSAPACAAIVACSRDRETPIRVAAEVAAERAWLATALGGVEAVQEVWPSAANFLLLRMADGLATVSGLADQGISVRPAGSFPGLGVDHVRVAVRRRPDNERLVEGLSNL